MKKTRQQIKDKLKSLSEKELRKLLVELFNHLDFKEVVEYHGINELGKDIVFYDVDKFSRQTWYACVVKAKDIGQVAYDDVARQINECHRKKYPSTIHGHVAINHVLVITNGVYKDNARFQIAELLTEKNKIETVEYWSVNEIAEKIEDTDLLDLLFDNKNIIQSLFNKEVLNNISSESSLKLLESDFDVNIGSLESFQIKIKAKAKAFENERGEYLKSIDISHNNIPVKFLPEVSEILKQNRPILLHGIATAGKTTILKKLGKDFINSGEPGYVFYLELAKYKDRLKSEEISVILDDIFFDLTKERFDLNKVEKGNFVFVLLDGLDEVSDTIIQDKIIAEILKANLISEVRVVITSRTNEFIVNHKELRESFSTYELLPLNLTEMIDLGSKILDQDDKKANFVKLLKKNEIIHSFPKTPLTTILLAVLFKEDKIDVRELPRNITELYSKFIDVFLNKWDRNKGISQQFKFQEKQFIIQKIAEHLHTQNMVSIDGEELIKFLDKLFLQHPIEGFKNSSDFLENILQRSSIIVRDFDDTYKFFHLTIQEYLAASLFGNEKEDFLVENFYDNWWLNANIFYAGRTPHQAAILNRICRQNENYPIDEQSKLSYIVHSSKVLQAAHLLDKTSRRDILISMIKVFDSLLREILTDFIDNPDSRIKKRTILEFILLGRRMFYEFFGSAQFRECLNEIRWTLLEDENANILDITEYCLSFCCALNSHSAKPLYEFLELKKDVNPRWFKIVDVDVNIKNLAIEDKKIVAKFKSKALKNKKYIQEQFKEILSKHYSSITGIK